MMSIKKVMAHFVKGIGVHGGGPPTTKNIYLLNIFVQVRARFCVMSWKLHAREKKIQAFLMHQLANKAHKLLSLLNKGTKCGRLIK